MTDVYADENMTGKGSGGSTRESKRVATGRSRSYFMPVLFCIWRVIYPPSLSRAPLAKLDGISKPPASPLCFYSAFL